MRICLTSNWAQISKEFVWLQAQIIHEIKQMTLIPRFWSQPKSVDELAPQSKYKGKKAASSFSDYVIFIDFITNVLTLQS